MKLIETVNQKLTEAGYTCQYSAFNSDIISQSYADFWVLGIIVLITEHDGYVLNSIKCGNTGEYFYERHSSSTLEEFISKVTSDCLIPPTIDQIFQNILFGEFDEPEKKLFLFKQEFEHFPESFKALFKQELVQLDKQDATKLPIEGALYINQNKKYVCGKTVAGKIYFRSLHNDTTFKSKIVDIRTFSAGGWGLIVKTEVEKIKEDLRVLLGYSCEFLRDLHEYILTSREPRNPSYSLRCTNGISDSDAVIFSENYAIRHTDNFTIVYDSDVQRYPQSTELASVKTVADSMFRYCKSQERKQRKLTELVERFVSDYLYLFNFVAMKNEALKLYEEISGDSIEISDQKSFALPANGAEQAEVPPNSALKLLENFIK